MKRRTHETEDTVNMTVSSTEKMQVRKGLPGLHLHYINSTSTSGGLAVGSPSIQVHSSNPEIVLFQELARLSSIGLGQLSLD